MRASSQGHADRTTQKRRIDSDSPETHRSRSAAVCARSQSVAAANPPRDVQTPPPATARRHRADAAARVAARPLLYDFPIAILALQDKALGGTSAAVAQMAQPSAKAMGDVEDYECVDPPLAQRCSSELDP